MFNDAPFDFQLINLHVLLALCNPAIILIKKFNAYDFLIIIFFLNKSM